MDDSANSLSLLNFFVNSFSVDTVYELGWYAARDWMILISGTLVAIAIAIRFAEEKAAFFTTGQTNYKKAATNILLVALAIGMYFVIAGLVIDLFNAIYGVLDTGTMHYMSQKLDGMMSKIASGNISIGLSSVFESMPLIGAYLAYGFSYCMLIFMIWAMRLAHACLVSFAIFWGAVALPMSITTGLKQLQPFKTIVLLALIWPIVDLFLMYLIGGAFLQGLDNSEMLSSGDDPLTTGELLFHLMAFAIINMFLIATTFAAPFVAQGIANGSGNVTGLVASFGGAALGAGALTASSMMGGMKAAGVKMWGKSAEDGGLGIKSGMERLAYGSEAATNKTGLEQEHQRAGASAFAEGGGSHTSASNNTQSNSGGASDSTSSGRSAHQSQTGNMTGNAASSAPASGDAKSTPLGESGNLTQEQLDQPSSADTEEGGDMAEQERREASRKQERRGAIINQQAGKR